MPINRISPVDARKQMETARAMTNSGIEFVCVPVYDDNRIEVRALAMSALDKLISEVEGGDDEQ